MRIRWHRLPAPVFLICCLVWLAWQLVTLACLILIWLLSKTIRAMKRANRTLSRRHAREKQLVCVSHPTTAPPRRSAIVVTENEQVPMPQKKVPVVRDAQYIERRNRLMAALGIKHEDIADGLLAKGYPVGW